ncbi:MAG TPA: zinc ribbon domain-containing protein [Thermodesulfobacteriota bacterium]|nr:zinc ribbon domain-containing protein [Thermodesulfobacteriota bacterium]
MNRQKFFKDGIIGEKDGGLALIGRLCRDCGKKSFPSPELCPYCASDKLEDVFLGDEVTVLAATTTRAPVPPYAPPFTLAIVDMEDEIRTIGRVEKDEQMKIKKGDKLAIKFGKLWEETEFNRKTKTNETIDVVGYYFVPKS